jgi:hypothetical protein
MRVPASWAITTGESPALDLEAGARLLLLFTDGGTAPLTPAHEPATKQAYPEQPQSGGLWNRGGAHTIARATG